MTQPHSIELERLINNNASKKVCEVGVWSGATSIYVLNKCPHIKEYYMVDPLSYDSNFFEYDSSNEDFPPIMSKNKYACTMGGKVRDQNQLDNMYNNIIKNVEKYNKSVFYRESSLEAVTRFEDDYLDLVFIDAIHLYEDVKKDIIAWMPKVKKGGVLSGDDYSNKFPGVVKAVNELFGDIVQVRSGVWSIVK